MKIPPRNQPSLSLIIMIIMYMFSAYSITQAEDNDSFNFLRQNLRKNTLANQSKNPQQTKACIKDNATNLIWEVKNNTGLQDKSSSYTWYSSNTNTLRESGTQNSSNCAKKVFCNTEQYRKDINSKKLCGISNWRLPTAQELQSLIRKNKGNLSATVNVNYFPNTVSGCYWTSDNNLGMAYVVDFGTGESYKLIKDINCFVRLVHSPGLATDNKNPDK